LNTSLEPGITEAAPAPDQGPAHASVIEISDKGTSLWSDLRELWHYRDLLWILTARDITVRYKQSALGAAWAVLQPLILMVVFTVVFGRFAGLPSDGVPYPLFVLSALLPWQYFSRSLTGSTGSLVASSALVSKVYFPRMILPLSKTMSGLVDFGIGFVLLAGVMAWYGVVPGWQIALLPLFILMAMSTALSVGLWLSATNVRYRDVGLVVPFLVQVWMYLSPIAYSSSVVPGRWKWLYSLNPVVGVVEGFRWALLGRTPPDPLASMLSLAAVALIFVSGLIHFRRTERTFADII
jgi:lipopolysaccharide transport system permease protein